MGASNYLPPFTAEQRGTVARAPEPIAPTDAPSADAAAADAAAADAATAEVTYADFLGEQVED